MPLLVDEAIAQTQQAVRDDFDNREFVEQVSQSIQQMAQFLSRFGSVSQWSRGEGGRGIYGLTLTDYGRETK